MNKKIENDAVSVMLLEAGKKMCAKVLKCYDHETEGVASRIYCKFDEKKAVIMMGFKH